MRTTIPKRQFFTIGNKSESSRFLAKIPLKNYLLASYGIALLTFGIFLLSFRHLPPEVPLFYGLPKGEEQLASSGKLFIPALLALITTIFNTFLILLLEDNFLKKSLVLASFGVNLLSLITTLRIITLVSSF